MAQHGREPVQATVSQQQADSWAQAGGDVVELYDGPTVWNAIATTDARRRELQAQIEQLQDRLAHAGIEQQRAVREERERCDGRCKDLRTVMVAAAEEIHAHWDAHCDAEGYGPANLMRRLEEGIPAQYGYTAGRFAELLTEAANQRAALTKARDALQKAMGAWGGTCAWHADVKAAIAAIDGLRA